MFIYEFFDTSGAVPLLGVLIGFLFSIIIFILPWNMEEKTVTYPLYKNEDNQYFTQSSNDGYITALCDDNGKKRYKEFLTKIVTVSNDCTEAKVEIKGNNYKLRPHLLEVLSKMERTTELDVCDEVTIYVPEGVSDESTEERVQEEEISDTYIICDSCGSENKSDAAFCKACGNKLEKAELHCRNCGAIIDQADTFCAKCGQKIKKE